MPFFCSMREDSAGRLPNHRAKHNAFAAGVCPLGYSPSGCGRTAIFLAGLPT